MYNSLTSIVGHGLKRWFDHITQDYYYIKDNDFTEKELKRLIRSGYIHQTAVVPLALLMPIGAFFLYVGISEGLYKTAGLGALYSAMGFSVYTIYMRYGWRHVGAHEKLEELRRTNLESIIQPLPQIDQEED